MTESKTDILNAPKGSPLRIYAWSTDEVPKYKGCLKIGQTTQDVKTRIKQSMGQLSYELKVWIDELASREDGTLFTDHDVHRRLEEKGIERVELEWFRCTEADVRTAIAELKKGIRYERPRHADFEMRAEQREAVERTYRYFQSVWSEDPKAEPRFLWNAKMRFGKTFAAYQLAKKLNSRRVLVVTFKPAVVDSWQTDLESHVDFDGWHFRSKDSDFSVDDLQDEEPLVYFGSFQDLLGRDATTNALKSKNEWIHTINWDLVIVDEYHFGSWRETAKELFAGEEQSVQKKETAAEFSSHQKVFAEHRGELDSAEEEFLPITTDAYLYLSGTPFRAIRTGEFVEEQIFNWTYTDEQRAKRQFSIDYPDKRNPYNALPEMRLMTYQMPDELIAIAHQGEFDEFDLNRFFEAKGSGGEAKFVHEDEVQKWLDILRGKHLPSQVDAMKTGGRPPFPYSDVRLLPYLQHSFWFLSSVASCEAMANLLRAKHNRKSWGDYEVLVVAGSNAGVGLDALPPVRNAIGEGSQTKTITLSCGKLTTGVTVPQWSAILMLRNLSSPETYFQAAFRVQSSWTIKNPNGDDPNEEAVIKPVCYVFDFAPTRALRQLSEYGMGLSPDESNPEKAVQELVNFLPVLAYDGSSMLQIDASAILDIATSGTTATLLARKWESAVLVNVDNATLARLLANEDAMKAIMNIEGFRALGGDVFERIINKSNAVKKTKKEKNGNFTEAEKKQLSADQKEYKKKRRQVQEKLIKFATRIPAFMYLTDYRENTLQDVITKLEPGLFKSVTGLTLADFELLVSIGVFNATHMNQAIFAFRRYEDSSLNYTGIESHQDLKHVGLYDTVVAIEQ